MRVLDKPKAPFHTTSALKNAVDQSNQSLERYFNIHKHQSSLTYPLRVLDKPKPPFHTTSALKNAVDQSKSVIRALF